MIGGSTPQAIAARFAAVAQMWASDDPRERAERTRRQLLSAVAEKEPATLNEVAAAVGRGAPAVSRSIDSLVRAGLVERNQDAGNRRRLALRLTQSGRERMTRPTPGSSSLLHKLERLANSELRAIERAIEILERSY